MYGFTISLNIIKRVFYEIITGLHLEADSQKRLGEADVYIRLL